MNLYSKLNLKQLRCFHAVATEGGFTPAAQSLGTGQPTITTHIKNLEGQFGIELFIRDRNRVKLTDAGRALLAVTRRMMSLEKEATEILTAAGGLKTGRLKIAAASPYQVSELIMKFGQQYPDVELSVSITNSHQALSHLLDFDCDIAVLAQAEKDPRIYTIPLNRDRLTIFVNRDHPWSGRQSIKLEELENQRTIFREVGSMTRWAFENALAQKEINVRRVLEIGSYEAVHEAVISGIGIGVVLKEEFVPADDLTALEISNADITIVTNVACLRERRGTPLINAFLKAMEQVVAGRNLSVPAAKP